MISSNTNDSEPEPNEPTTNPSPGARGRESGPTLGEVMALVAGLGVAFALFAETLRADDRPTVAWHLWPLMILGGLSLPMPWLIARRHQRNVHGAVATPPPSLMDWNAWEFLVAIQGWAAWMTWPPLVMMRWNNQKVHESATFCTYFFGTPLMSLAVLATLIQTQGIRGLRRRGRLGGDPMSPASHTRPPLPWTTTFAMILGALWALSGLHFLVRVIWEDWRR